MSERHALLYTLYSAEGKGQRERAEAKGGWKGAEGKGGGKGRRDRGGKVGKRRQDGHERQEKRRAQDDKAGANSRARRQIQHAQRTVLAAEARAEPLALVEEARVKERLPCRSARATPNGQAQGHLFADVAVLLPRPHGALPLRASTSWSTWASRAARAGGLLGSQLPLALAPPLVAQAIALGSAEPAIRIASASAGTAAAAGMVCPCMACIVELLCIAVIVAQQAAGPSRSRSRASSRSYRTSGSWPATYPAIKATVPSARASARRGRSRRPVASSGTSARMRS